jgi:pyoverdine/dityrosine biosynthesis protein Dit1
MQTSSHVGSANRKLEIEILSVFMAYRRTSDAGAPGHPLCEACLAPHRAKVRAAMAQGMPIHFVLPAFPAKSPNPRKVLGRLPDLAERLALRFLRDRCRRIQAIYAPGARLTLCSDGHVFGDLVGVSDADVSAYGEEMGVLIEALGLSEMDRFCLEEGVEGASWEARRETLVQRYAAPCEALREQIRGGGPMRDLFNGIARFLFEDLLALEGETVSRNALRLRAHDRAYPVIQRSQAWSRLIAERFPDAVRLSIHPTPCHGEKIGIHLVETCDNWLTPWHGVAVDVGDRMVLMKRFQAESLNARLIRQDGRPSHFAAFQPLYREERSPCYAQAA